MESEGFFALSITSVASDTLIAKATLTCNPEGGTHPNPTAACTQLRAVEGRIEDIPEDPGPCTEEFDPVLVSASGSWRGAQRRFEKEFSNRCFAVRGTGGVLFNFDGIDEELNPQPEPPG
jgi:hypothetical protein